MTPDALVALALSLPGATESAHFGKRDFRRDNRIFMSLPSDSRAVLKLTPDQQLMLVETEPGLFSPVPSAWGAKGWTLLEIDACPVDIATLALTRAWENVAVKASAKRR